MTAADDGADPDPDGEGEREGEDGESGGRLIDAQGRLFGLVNIVDALVVLLVAAVVIAGVVLLLPSEGEQESRFVTMDLGGQPEFIAGEISPGDSWEPEGTGDELVITDVYRTAAGDETGVVVRAQVNGTVTEPADPTAEPVFEFLGEPLRTGGTYTLVTTDYEAEGQVTRVDRTGETLSTAQTEFVIETTVGETTAGEVSVGDEFRLAGETIATIETIQRAPAGDDQRLLLGMRGETITRDGTQLFGGSQLSVGATVGFVGPGYELSGAVIQRGTSQIERTEQSVVAETTVSAATAETIETGDRFVVDDETVATIETIQRVPAGDDQRVVRLGLTLATIDDGTERFAGRSVRIGATVPFETDEYQLSAEIVRRGTSQIERTEQSVVAETTVSAATAQTIETGDRFVVDDETVATIDSLALYPAGEDRRVARLGLTLATIDDGTERFAGRSVRIGATVPFETDEYQLSAEIIARGTSQIETEQTELVVETTVPTSVAEDITAGDAYTIAGEPIVTVESVTSYVTDAADQRRVLIGVTATVREDDGELRFGDRRLRVGTDLPIRTGEYDVTGEIVTREQTVEPGEPTTRTVVFGVENVPPERADSLEVGLEEQSGGQRTALVEEKIEEPAVIVLTSEDGDIFQREHPVNRDVEFTVELTVRELEDGSLRFRGEPLRTGQQLTLELGSVRITGEVFEIHDE